MRQFHSLTADCHSMPKIRVILVLIVFSNLSINELSSQLYFQDCENPFSICEYGDIYIESTDGIGLIKDDISANNCQTTYISETNSSWFSWKCETDGYFSFIINPSNYGDDIDFILYESDANDCTQLNSIRCMLSGRILSEQQPDNACLGSTGLRLDAVDICEVTGCSSNSDNFLKFVEAKAGVTYFLFVNNFNSSEGFNLFLEGNAKLIKQDKCKSIDSNFLVSLSPNPVATNLKIDISGSQFSEYTLQILTTSGRVISSTQYEMNDTNKSHSINVGSLNNGSHFLRIATSEEVKIKHFIKI